MQTNNEKQEALTVSELSEYVKNIVANKKVKVTGEVSQPKLSSGHLYFSLKDNYSNIKSIVWKSKNINKDLITAGAKVTLDCKLDYYCGSVNLIVDKVMVEEEKGSIHIKYENIKKEFYEKGYFDTTHKKPLPNVIKNILIYTSTDAGVVIEDFKYNIMNNNANINIVIEHVSVQGANCTKDICSKLNSYDTNINYDLIVIIRGGGSFEDLFGFSQPELIETIYNFKGPPILTAIGHMVDNPLVDLVADVSAPTPSLAAQFIVDHNKKYIDSLYDIMNTSKNNMMDSINKTTNNLIRMNEKLHRSFNIFYNMKYQLQNNIKEMINADILRLKIMDSKLEPEVTSITLYNNMNKINTPEDLDELKGNKIKLRWGDKEYNIKIY